MAEPLTVLVDEGCGICTRIGAWLARRSGVEVSTIGTARGALLLRDLSTEERYASVHVVDQAGRRFSAGAALPLLLRIVPAGRGAAIPATLLPELTERAYGFVARNRRTLSRVAGLGACAAHEPDDEATPSRRGSTTDSSHVGRNRSTRDAHARCMHE
jgi:predicted DCC family thiol-disulfide oxidoreductase YuxK